MLGRKHLELLGCPGVILLEKLHAAHVILVVRIEAGRDENHLRLEVVEPRQPDIRNRTTKFLATGPGRQGHIDHVFGGIVGTTVGIERVLENTAHQHLVVALENILGTVTVMNIEVDDRHALKPMHLDRMRSSNSNVVEEAEAHRVGALGMVAGRADRTEGILNFVPHDQVDCHATGTGRTQCCRPGMRTHRRIRVEVGNSLLRRRALDPLQMRSRMYAQQLFKGCQRCVVVGEIGIDPLRDQVVADGGEAGGRLRMIGAHIVQLAISVRNECGSGHLLSLRYGYIVALHPTIIDSERGRFLLLP